MNIIKEKINNEIVKIVKVTPEIQRKIDENELPSFFRPNDNNEYVKYDDIKGK